MISPPLVYVVVFLLLFNFFDRNCAQRKVNSNRFYFHYAIFMPVFVSVENLDQSVGIYRIHLVLVI